MHIHELEKRALSTLQWMTDKRLLAMKRLGLQSVLDLLLYAPLRYNDRTQLSSIQDAILHGSSVSTIVEVEHVDRFLYRGKLHPKILVNDHATRAYLVGFHRPHLTKSLVVGGKYWVHGSFSLRANQIQCSDFEWEPYVDGKVPESFAKVLPVYALCEGLSQKDLRKILAKTIQAFTPLLNEHLPAYLLERRRLCGLSQALENLHFPQSMPLLHQARTRLVYEELLGLQLAMAYSRFLEQDQPRVYQYPAHALTDQFLGNLPFALTAAQSKVLQEIRENLQSAHPMRRLLQGDVGSGKTIVAMGACVLAFENGVQSALMVPTEVLAMQNARKFRDLLAPLGIQVGLLTGSVPAAQRKDILDQLAHHTIHVLVGTHAIFQTQVQYAQLGMVMIDEQHKFGVRERLLLSEKSHQADLLLMTATPIPRSIALTLYGDLDLSLMDELPPGRQVIRTTWVHQQEQYRQMIQHVQQELHNQRQAFFIYPLVESSERLRAKAVTDMFQELQQYFPEATLDLVHGRMSSAEKEEAMQKFLHHESDILVSTTVIEVGVDIPNASVIVIENAERFGLAQLHQLRGRVGRGNTKAYCYLVTHTPVQAGLRERMQILCQSNNGFEITEADLRMRGEGNIAGTQQSGFYGLKLASITRDQKILQTARSDAQYILQHDPRLTQQGHASLKDHLLSNHFIGILRAG